METAEPSLKGIWASIRRAHVEVEGEGEDRGLPRGAQRGFGVVLLAVTAIFLVAMFAGLWGPADSDGMALLLVLFAVVGAVGISLVLPRRHPVA